MNLNTSSHYLTNVPFCFAAAAGGKELAVLIFLFSFVWPYTKQLITLFLWFAKPGIVSVKKRGSILLWLDALAKWSMVDIFTLVVTIVAFRVSIQRYVLVLLVLICFSNLL